MKKERRAAAAPDQQSGPVEQTVMTDGATIAPPVITGADTAGTITAPPPAPEQAPASEPITHPAEGGSYVRDPETGHLTRLED